MQKYEAYEPRSTPTAAEDQLADRLDRLSVPLAENVIRRAIDMHHDETFDDSIDWAAVEQIGAELGIDVATVRKALLDELETERDDVRGLWDRLFAPDRVSGGIVAEADADVVADRLDEWMREHEGLEAAGRHGGTIRWEPTRSVFALLKTLGMTGRTTGVLRSADRVVSRQTDVVDGHQLIEISANTKDIRSRALAVVSLFVFVGLVVGTNLAAGSAFIPALVKFFAGFVPSVAVGFWAAMRTARAQLSKIKRGINRALDGIVHLTTLKRRAGRNHRHSERPRWFDIVEEIFEEVFDD